MLRFLLTGTPTAAHSAAMRSPSSFSQPASSGLGEYPAGLGYRYDS